MTIGIAYSSSLVSDAPLPSDSGPLRYFFFYLFLSVVEACS